MSGKPAEKHTGISSMKWRIVASGGLLALCIASTVRIASGAFEPASIPVADISPQNAMVSGTMRMAGNRFLLYNGTRLESMAQSMQVNFERGGSMMLCPRSQLQILSSNGNSGIMLAFQSGGSQQLFPIQMGDEVLTPDWRVELTSDARQGDMGMVQIITNRHGDLCLQGNSQAGAYFRVSQTVGNASFQVDDGRIERFSNGKMESSDQSCGCDANDTVKGDEAAQSAPVHASPAESETAVARVQLPPRPSVSRWTANSAPQAVVSPAPDAAPVRHKKHPEDVAGYIHSFVKMMFGR